MRVKTIKLRNFGNISSVDLDMTEIPNGLVSLAGESGSGKTHLISSFFEVPLYRRVSFYDDWVQGHFGKDGGSVTTEMEVRGDVYSFLLRGKKDETPSCFIHKNDIPIAGPGVREYDAAIVEIFPNRPLLLASRHTNQNDIIGFFGMAEGVRRKIFSSMMGTDEIDQFLEILKRSKVRLNEELKDIVSDMSSSIDAQAAISRNDRDAKALRDRVITDNVEQLKSLLDEKNHHLSTIAALRDQEEKLRETQARISVELGRIWKVYEDAWRIFRSSEVAYLSSKKISEDMVVGLAGVDMSIDICRVCPLTQGAQSRIATAVDMQEVYERARESWIAFCANSEIGEIMQNEASRAAEIGDQIQLHVTTERSSISEVDAKAAALGGWNIDIVKIKSDIDMELYRIESENKIYQKVIDNLPALKGEKERIARELQAVSIVIALLAEERINRVGIVMPKLEAVANTLLSAYQSGRFQIKMNTSLPQKGGTMKENFSPTIIDNLTGEERFKVSGGESAILSEALRMGFSCVHSELSGMEGGDMVRDEAMSNVSENFLDCYISIIRDGLAYGGFDHIVISSHSKQIMGQCDSFIRMDHGKIIEIAS